MSGATLLVVAKAPIEGEVKTRLAHDLGGRFDIAADLAAAALLDTLDSCVQAQQFACFQLALAGNLDRAARGGEIGEALRDWEVVPQRGSGLAERLANAHSDIAGPVVQVGMDTPHLQARVLDEIALQLTDNDAALGLASDGGWWTLGCRTGSSGRLLRHVPMSVASTGRATREALVTSGLSVAEAPTLTDIDHLEDAFEVADHTTRFAAAMQSWNLSRRAA